MDTKRKAEDPPPDEPPAKVTAQTSPKGTSLIKPRRTLVKQNPTPSKKSQKKRDLLLRLRSKKSTTTPLSERTTTPRKPATPKAVKSPTTPGKTPKRTAKLEMKKETAKTITQHIYGRLVLDSNANTREERKALYDKLAANLVITRITYSQDPAWLDRKTFSNITEKEYYEICDKHNLVSGGKIVFGSTSQLLGDIAVPADFMSQVKLVRRVHVAKSEPRCRLNIGLFLVNAVALAKQYLKARKVVLFSEVPVNNDKLPGIGPIEGNLDYLTSQYSGVVNFAENLHANVRPEKPYLLVVEAKTHVSITEETSLYQLIAQLLTVEHEDSSEEGRWGCLTTGDRWDFYYIEKKMKTMKSGRKKLVGYRLYDLVNVKAVTDTEMNNVMGILYHIVGKFLPSESDVVHLIESKEDEWDKDSAEGEEESDEESDEEKEEGGAPKVVELGGPAVSE